ncbi:hypothetical protein PWY87_24270 [Kribbella solani]|uniref:hypothetical protein n=1 Tax=Kribbella solani TaxID=236067 RepID=UPI0029B2B9F7|nr:hypothetical protein [Kribbella solani]MDX3004821.1 hypothetical protein [Kribbella solani]
MTDPLHDLLTELAETRAGTPRLNDADLLSRIRHRRRRRVAMISAGGVAATVLCGFGAYAVLPGDQPPAVRPASAPSRPTQPLPTKPLPTKPYPSVGEPRCGSSVDEHFPSRVPSGMDNLEVHQQAFTRTEQGWAGTLQIKVTGQRALDQFGPRSTVEVRRDRKLIGNGVVTMTQKSGQTVTVRLTLTACSGPITPGSVVLYGQLIPGKNPMTIFPISL